jgi:simple sugar transport system substrate-binding protein
MRTHVRVLAAFGFIFGVSASGITQAAEPTIIFVTHGQAADSFWSIVKKGADDAGKAMHVRVLYRAPASYDMTQMSQLIAAAANQHPDGIVVSIPHATALGTAIRSAVAGGFP